MHVPPWATDTQGIKHFVEKQTIILCRAKPVATFRLQKIANNRSFFVRQVAAHSPVSAKTSFESDLQQPKKVSCRENLVS